MKSTKEEIEALVKKLSEGVAYKYKRILAIINETESDVELLQDIYERNDMQVIANSDIYLRGFQDGLDYNKDLSHGNPDVCPDCGSGVYNCKCQ